MRFALLYWAGRERPCTLDGSGTTCPFTQPYKDQLRSFRYSLTHPPEHKGEDPCAPAQAAVAGP